eukprot:8911489-Karenia_brevis.AAC.2
MSSSRKLAVRADPASRVCASDLCKLLRQPAARASRVSRLCLPHMQVVQVGCARWLREAVARAVQRARAGCASQPYVTCPGGLFFCLN